MNDTENAVKSPETIYREKVQAEIDAAQGHIYALECVKVRVFADIVVAINKLVELAAPPKHCVEQRDCAEAVNVKEAEIVSLPEMPILSTSVSPSELLTESTPVQLAQETAKGKK